MTLTEFYDEVARHADTEKIAVTAADTKRVLATAFTVMCKMHPADAADVVSKGLALARKKAETPPKK